MAGSVFDSALYARLFSVGEVGRLFTDSAEIRAMLLVEGALARVQGEMGVIPSDSAAYIERCAMEVQIDPAALAAPTGQNGVSVPGLVAAFRDAMQGPDHAQYAHWGATSQDIIDTGLMLRLRQALTLIEADLRTVLTTLAELADTHASLPMVARTYGQHATPTSFGAVVAAWGAPLLALMKELAQLRPACLCVSLSGAAGTSSALGPQASQLRSALADRLDLADPQRSWHTDRTPILRLGDWLTRTTLATAKIGEDVTELTQSGIGEVTLDTAGSSSTMPQKANPVGPSILVALARQNTGLNATLQGSSLHRHQRDGAAWFTEWMCLPQIVLAAASALQTTVTLTRTLSPDPARMAAALQDGLDMIHAEALSFALAAHMSRPDAQAAVKTLCQDALQTRLPLRQLVRRDWPDLDLADCFDPNLQMGRAPQDAQDFAAAVCL